MRRQASLLLALMGCTPHLHGEVAGPWEAPENTWAIGQPPADLQAEGWAEGQVVPDLRAVDQFGDEVSLWQFHGQVVLLDVSALWCINCGPIASGIEGIYDALGARGFQPLTLITEDLRGDVPETGELNEGWTQPYGITTPVTADVHGAAADITPDGLYPRFRLIDRDGRVLDAGIQPYADGDLSYDSFLAGLHTQVAAAL